MFTNLAIWLTGAPPCTRVQEAGANSRQRRNLRGISHASQGLHDQLHGEGKSVWDGRRSLRFLDVSKIFGPRMW